VSASPSSVRSVASRCRSEGGWGRLRKPCARRYNARIMVGTNSECPSPLSAVGRRLICKWWATLLAGSLATMACTASGDLAGPGAPSGATAGATTRGGNGVGGAAGSSLMGTGGIGKGGVSGTGGTMPESTDCTGTPHSCGSNLNSWYCAREHGCTQSYEGCLGTPAACATYSTSTSCLLNGCTWTGPVACDPTPVTSDCAEDVTITTPCQVCLHSKCCGQLTACTEDAVCSSKYSGSLYEAYINCGVNCCSDSCDW
jgi:hypothetical protein